MTKSTTNELLWFVLVHLIYSIWKSLSFLPRANNFPNCDQTFLIFTISLTNTYVATTARQSYVSDSLSAFRAF